MRPRLARLSRDSLIYGVGGAAVRYTGLILLPIFTRTFSADQYGILESVLNLNALLLAVASAGLDGAAPLLYFETEDPVQRRRVSTLWVWISVVVSVPLTLLLLYFADWVSLAASGTTDNADLFRLGISALPFSLLLVVFTGVLRMAFRPRAYALLNFSLTTLIALVSIYLVVFTGLGLAGALWGVLLGNVTICIAGAWAVRDIVGLRALRERARPVARRLLKLGLPLVPASVALWVISFSNTYFLIQMAGPEDAGVFRVGVRLAAFLGLGVWAFQLAWGPLSLSLARDPDAPRIYSRVATLYTAGSVGASVLLAAGAPLLLLLFATADYALASSVIGTLALSAAALGAYYVVALGVNLAQRTGQIAWTTLVAATLSIALNFLLIPVWGIVGAALAALAANLTSTLLIYAMSQRYHPLPYETPKMLAIWLVGSACVVVASVLNVAVPLSPWLQLALALVLAALYLAALFALGAITRSEIIAAWVMFTQAIKRRMGR